LLGPSRVRSRWEVTVRCMAVMLPERCGGRVTVR
jgi:hypothetical protein